TDAQRRSAPSAGARPTPTPGAGRRGPNPAIHFRRPARFPAKSRSEAARSMRKFTASIAAPRAMLVANSREPRARLAATAAEERLRLSHSIGSSFMPSSGPRSRVARRPVAVEQLAPLVDAEHERAESHDRARDQPARGRRPAVVDPGADSSGDTDRKHGFERSLIHGGAPSRLLLFRRVLHRQRRPRARKAARILADDSGGLNGGAPPRNAPARLGAARRAPPRASPRGRPVGAPARRSTPPKAAAAATPPPPP